MQTDQIVIRIAEEQDRQVLIREYIQTYSPDLEEAQKYVTLHLTVDRALLAEVNGAFAGMLTWGVREGVRHGLAQVTGVRTELQFRRQGVGKRLFEEAKRDMEQYFAEKGTALRQVFGIAPESAATHAFWEGQGLRKVGEVPDYREDGVVGVVYVGSLWAVQARS